MNTNDKGQSPQKTHINVNVLKQIKTHCDTVKLNPLTKKQDITIEDIGGYGRTIWHIHTILDTIEMLSFDCPSKPQDVLTNIGYLSELAKKMLPVNEMDFLDSLLIEGNHTDPKFLNIDKLDKILQTIEP